MKVEPLESIPGRVVLLYYRSREDFETYRNTPVAVRLQWLQDQMEFLYKAMPPRSKEIREKLFGYGSCRN